MESESSMDVAAARWSSFSAHPVQPSIPFIYQTYRELEDEQERTERENDRMCKNSIIHQPTSHKWYSGNGERQQHGCRGSEVVPSARIVARPHRTPPKAREREQREEEREEVRIRRRTKKQEDDHVIFLLARMVARPHRTPPIITTTTRRRRGRRC